MHTQTPTHTHTHRHTHTDAYTHTHTQTHTHTHTGSRMHARTFTAVVEPVVVPLSNVGSPRPVSHSAVLFHSFSLPWLTPSRFFALKFSSWWGLSKGRISKCPLHSHRGRLFPRFFFSPSFFLCFFVTSCLRWTEGKSREHFHTL